MPAPTFVASTVQGAILGADLIMTVPVGTDGGDLMVFEGLCAGGTTIAAHADWTTRAESFGTQAPLMTRVAAGAVGSPTTDTTFTFVTGGAGNSSARIASYRGVDPTTPIDAVGVVSGATGVITLPSITSNGAERLLVQMPAKLGSTTFTGPGSQTERYDSQAPNSGYTSAGGDETVGAGATGTRAWTPAAGTQGSIGYMLALAPPSSASSSAGFLSLI